MDADDGVVVFSPGGTKLSSADLRRLATIVCESNCEYGWEELQCVLHEHAAPYHVIDELVCLCADKIATVVVMIHPSQSIEIKPDWDGDQKINQDVIALVKRHLYNQSNKLYAPFFKKYSTDKIVMAVEALINLYSQIKKEGVVSMS